MSTIKEKLAALRKHKGISGIIVAVFLCIIAVVLSVFFRDEVTKFIQTVVQTMTNNAEQIFNSGNYTGIK